MRRSFVSSWRLVQGFVLFGLLLVASCSQDPQPAGDNGDGNGTCAVPNQVCNGACVNTSADATNCGTCGRACVVGESCQAGQCVRSCAPQVDCGGQCADTTSNSLHCGGCGRGCASGQICQNSACVTGGCPVGQTSCNGACVDL